MDTFFEQIVPIKKTAKDYLAIFGIWFAALLLSFLAIAFLPPSVFALSIALIFIIFYGAFTLSKRLFIEYEYIVTNGTLDVDKIIAKSSRKRVMSIEIKDVSSVEKYNPNKKSPTGTEKEIIACNKDDSNAFCLVISKEGKGKQILAFSPDDRIKEGILKSLPRFLSNSAFK